MAGNSFENITTGTSNVFSKLPDALDASKTSIMRGWHKGVSKEPATRENIIALTAVSVALPLFPVFLLAVVLVSHFFKANYL